jgi:hypothetical protein
MSRRSYSSVGGRASDFVKTSPKQNAARQAEIKNQLTGNRQNNLADVFAALHQFVRFGGIFQGKTGCDEGFDLSAFDQRPDFGAQIFRDACFGPGRPGAEG